MGSLESLEKFGDLNTAMVILHSGVWQFAIVRWKAELDHTLLFRSPFSVLLGRRLQGDTVTSKDSSFSCIFLLLVAMVIPI